MGTVGTLGAASKHVAFSESAQPSGLETLGTLAVLPPMFPVRFFSLCQH